MTTTESAKELRKALKAKGWNARKVSARTEYYSMGSSVTVTVRDASVPFFAVKKMATHYCEDIDRDERTGEILSGGNTYVHVERTDEVKETTAARYLDAVKAAIAKLEPANPTYCFPVDGVKNIKNVSIGYENPPSVYGIRVWLGNVPGYSTDASEDGARLIALQIADAEVGA